MGTMYFVQNVTQFAGSTAVGLAAGYTASTDYVCDVRGMKTIEMHLFNDGSSTVTYEVLGSVDNKTEYDITAVTETTLAGSAYIKLSISGLYTHLKLRSKAASGTLTVKIISQSN